MAQIFLVIEKEGDRLKTRLTRASIAQVPV